MSSKFRHNVSRLSWLPPLQLRKIKGSFFWRFSFFAKLVLFAGALRELANGLQAHSCVALVTLKQIKTSGGRSAP